MAIFHRATIVPTKEQLIADWAPTRPWGPSSDDPIEVIGSYRFDDPEGRVGMETFLVNAAGALIQVPLTYRDQPLVGAEDALITKMEHSVLGTRWVYDGVCDPRFVVMLAGVAMTGQGEALGMAAAYARNELAHSVVPVVDQARSVLAGDGTRLFDVDVIGANLVRVPDQELHAVGIDAA